MAMYTARYSHIWPCTLMCAALLIEQPGVTRKGFQKTTTTAWSNPIPPLCKTMKTDDNPPSLPSPIPNPLTVYFFENCRSIFCVKIVQGHLAQNGHGQFSHSFIFVRSNMVKMSKQIWPGQARPCRAGPHRRPENAGRGRLPRKPIFY